MKNQQDCHALKYGFTLVELSIVLVIIGLLVGGIAGLRNYVKNAQLNTVMNESKIFASAFSQFQTRYNAPPGDYNAASLAWSGAGNGDGNGLIRATGSAPGNVGESYYTFQHLALAGFIQGSYTGAANGTGGATVGVNVPGSSMDNVAFLFDHPDVLDGFVGGADAAYYTGSYGNVLRVAGLNANATAVPDQAFLTGKQGYQIDDKFDDGKPITGNIVAPKSLAGCVAGAGYATDADAPVCYFILKMQ